MWFSLGYPGSGVKGVAGHPDPVGGGSGIRAGDPRWLTGRPRGTLVRRTKPTHEGPRRESVHAQAGSGAAEGGPGDRGVCAGLGRRFGLGPWQARILFVVILMLIPGSQILIYPLLWILMPSEPTT